MQIKRVTKHAIDDAIERWLRALEKASPPSVQAIVQRAGELGCMVQASPRPTSPRLVGLCSAERPLAACTSRERMVLALRYRGAESTTREGWAGGEWTVLTTQRLLPYRAIARALETSEAGVQRCVARARAKIAELLREG